MAVKDKSVFMDKKKHRSVNFLEMQLDIKGDPRGSLIALESEVDVPFKLKRVFFIYGTNGDVVRGSHANKKSKFMLISVNGKCEVTIKLSSGDVYVSLDNPSKALYLDRMVWKEMHSFSEDCVLMVLCSEHYDSTEYIYDFNEYLEARRYG